MTQTTSPRKDEYMQDPQGRLVPISMIDTIDIERDRTVTEIFEDTKKIREQVNRFKERTNNRLNQFLTKSFRQHNVKFGGTKGNLTLTSYSGKYKIIKAINDYIDFNEKLQVAKQLIKVLVNDAFYVDKKGKINTNRILGLRRLNIKDGKWKKAMQAISDSIQIIDSKSYIRVYERMENGQYKYINLDPSSLS